MSDHNRRPGYHWNLRARPNLAIRVSDYEQELRVFVAPKPDLAGRRCTDCGCVLRSGNKQTKCAPCEKRFLSSGTLTEIKEYFGGKRS